jgi:hypothetical protein
MVKGWDKERLEEDSAQLAKERKREVLVPKKQGELQEEEEKKRNAAEQSVCHFQGRSAKKR